MKRIIGLVVLAALVVGVAWFVQRGAEERAARRVIEEVPSAALSGLNSHNANALDEYLAIEAEGA